MAKSELKAKVELLDPKDVTEFYVTRSEINGCAPGYKVGVLGKIRPNYWVYQWFNGPLTGEQFKLNPASL